SKHVIIKGGAGSGHHGHSGRPGKVGGSLPSGGLGATPISNDEKELHTYLTMVADMKRGQGRKDFKYAGMEDMILKHGKFFKPPQKGDKLPKGCEAGEPKECYRNSIMNSISNEDLIYTEGYATSPSLPGFGFQHAWLTTSDGKVIDPTWTGDKVSPGTAYFGIQMDKDFVLATTARTGMAGIIANDWMDDSRLMKDGFPKGAMITKEMKVALVWEKGGAGSGHYGHAGRPGKVGGSVPGSLLSTSQINPAYFTKGPGKKLLEGMKSKARGETIEILSDKRYDLKAYHFRELGKISTQSSYDNPDSFVMTEEQYGKGPYGFMAGQQAGGIYDQKTKIIHINNAIGLIPVSRQTLFHELGHHQENIMSHDNYTALSGARFDLAVNLGVADYMGKPGSEWSQEAKMQVFDLGLRPYSFLTTGEFIADTFKLQAVRQGNSIRIIEGLVSKGQPFEFKFSNIYDEGKSPYD
ncbi:hypothetical protein LCGC14_0956850, partial [marine sediment metagenome]